MKETIIAESDGSDYLHAGKYEQSFEHEHHMSMIFTSKIFTGKVKITIESIGEK